MYLDNLGQSTEKRSTNYERLPIKQDECNKRCHIPQKSPNAWRTQAGAAVGAKEHMFETAGRGGTLAGSDCQNNITALSVVAVGTEPSQANLI